MDLLRMSILLVPLLGATSALAETTGPTNRKGLSAPAGQPQTVASHSGQQSDGMEQIEYWCCSRARHRSNPMPRRRPSRVTSSQGRMSMLRVIGCCS